MTAMRLYYGGEKHNLDQAEAEVFAMALRKAIEEGGGGVQFVEAKLTRGATLSIAVGAGIPVALMRGRDTDDDEEQPRRRATVL